MPNEVDTLYDNENKSRGGSMRTLKFGWLIFALVMIFNPNIQLIDFLPDFIGFFILAKFIEKAADAAPYFEEARVAFTKLGYITLAKLPAMIIVRLVRSENTLDNDIVALMVLIFAVLETIYLIPAIKNIFEALTYLGERNGMESIMKSDSLISTDNIRSFTYVFVILKCILYTLPEFFKLTRSVDMGNSTALVTGSGYYPWAILLSLTLGFIFGGIWLSRMVRFAKRIRNEGKFFSSLENMATAGSYTEYEKRIVHRERNRIFLLFILASALSLDLKFSNYNEINLLPSFVFGVLFFIGLIGLVRLSGAKELRATVLTVGILYNTVSAATYIYEFKFLDNYGYSALLSEGSTDASKLYSAVKIFACVEAVLYICLFVLFYLLMTKYAKSRLGHFKEDSSEVMKKTYYKEINKKTLILSIIGGLLGIATLAQVFINGNVKLIFTDSSDVTMPTLIVPDLPWFGLVLTAITVIYAFYSVYYFNFIKEEEAL